MTFYVTGLLDFTLVCGEIRNLKAREVVLGYDLSEEEEQILSRQMNLVLSYEKEGFERPSFTRFTIGSCGTSGI